MDFLTVRIPESTFERLLDVGALCLADVSPDNTHTKARLKSLAVTTAMRHLGAHAEETLCQFQRTLTLFTQLPNAATAALLIALSEELLTVIPTGHASRFRLRALQGMLTHWL